MVTMKTVLAAGVFDLLHYGHIRYLEEAKKTGGEGARLIVIVARDETVLRLKGHSLRTVSSRATITMSLAPSPPVFFASSRYLM